MVKIMNKKITFVLVLALAAFLVMGSASAGLFDFLGGSSDDTVKIGYLPSDHDAALFVADAQGLYKEKGINTEIVQFNNGGDLMTAMASGDVDVGYVGISPVLSSAYTKGAGEIKSTHAGELEIGVAKVIGHDGNFDSAEINALPAVMSAPSDVNIGLREIRFDDFQGFPDASTKLYYTAWYPQEADYSNTNEGQTDVTFDIPTDASTDVLYSDVTSGTRLTGFKPMVFQHALVKYTIKVYAMESDDAPGSVADVWGKIQSVTLEGMQSDCVLTLPSSEQCPLLSFCASPLSLHSILNLRWRVKEKERASLVAQR